MLLLINLKIGVVIAIILEELGLVVQIQLLLIRLIHLYLLWE